MVSLWPVDDSATSEILIDFYKRLSSGKSPAVALQEAQGSFFNQHAGSRRANQGNSNNTSDRAITQQLSVRRIGLQRDITNNEQVTHTDHSLLTFWGPFILMSA
ncbi:hypothetical protein BDV27DRAFT_138200 [Aspergillus caelatus]|uniref:CHAT domain-containing protein n=1 Tax=Aspergillus caelatus TaxID=61420 RepID=A0A5N6ZKF7_9EURO|nr:uncharacterized protein BDV27DRAFT_138200 [Aspergillus caelatus]KAE8358107.1 hypothetical protein BDV27DRAFT_138200 [Aspergillus caelatus]